MGAQARAGSPSSTHGARVPAWPRARGARRSTLIAFALLARPCNCRCPPVAGNRDDTLRLHAVPPPPALYIPCVMEERAHTHPSPFYLPIAGPRRQS